MSAENQNHGSIDAKKYGSDHAKQFQDRMKVMNDGIITSQEEKALFEKFGEDNEALNTWLNLELTLSMRESQKNRVLLTEDIQKLVDNALPENLIPHKTENSTENFSVVSNITPSTQTHTEAESNTQTSPEPQKEPEKSKDKYVSETAVEIKAGEKSGNFVVLTKESALNVRNEKGEKISTLKKGQEIETTGKFVELGGEKFLEVKNNQFVNADFLKEIPQTEVAKNTETPENTKEENPTIPETTQTAVAETSIETTPENFNLFASLNGEKLNLARKGEEVFIGEGMSVTSDGNNFIVQQANTSFTVKLSDITHKNEKKDTVFNTPENLKNTFTAQYNTELAKDELKPLEKMIAKTEISAPESIKSDFKNGKISFDNVKLSKDAHNQTLVHLDLDTKGFNKKEHKNLEFVLGENMIASGDIQQTLQTMIASHLELNQNPNKAITQTKPIDNSSKV